MFANIFKFQGKFTKVLNFKENVTNILKKFSRRIGNLLGRFRSSFSKQMICVVWRRIFRKIAFSFHSFFAARRSPENKFRLVTFGLRTGDRKWRRTCLKVFEHYEQLINTSYTNKRKHFCDNFKILYCICLVSIWRREY